MPDHRPRPGQLESVLPELDAQTLAETLVAMANADGGTIYIGIDERGVPTDVYPEQFAEAARLAEDSCFPPVNVTWQQIEARGAFVFIGRVQRSLALHRLRDGRVLVRTGAENRLLSEEEVEDLLATHSTMEYEAEVVPGATRDDLDPEVLREFVAILEERQGRQLTRPLDDFLKEMGWLSLDGRPTVAGLLLFGRHPQTFIPRSGLVFVRFEGITQVRHEDGSPGYGRRVDLEGPLARVIENAWEILQQELRVGAVVRGLERREQWLYPPAAIREALVNAVAHRDYRLRGRSIEVRMFSDRLEIVSPGKLPGFVTLDNIVEEHFSRNPRIVKGLYEWGFIEELGLGVDLMIQEMVRAGHNPPLFKETPHSFSVIFMQARERVPLETPLLGNERQARALAYIAEHGRITNREYQQLCPGVSPETLRLDLADLVEQGVLLKVGDKRGTYYIMK